MRNKYPGRCYRCGQQVEAGAGHFERTANGWRTQHAECAIAYRREECPRCGKPAVSPPGRGFLPGDYEQHKGRRWHPACWRAEQAARLEV